MREIKFRFWDKKDGVMIDWLTVRQTAFNRGEMHLCYDVMGTNPNIVKMQFTGLTDGKDREIYEGDIIQTIDGKIMPVVYEGGCWRTPFKDSSYRLGGWIKNRIKIIGNIFETPHLLNQ